MWSGDWASVEVHVLVFHVHCPGAISSRRDWDQVPDDARQRAPTDTGRSQYVGSSVRVIPVDPQQVLVMPRLSTSGGPDRPPKELQLFKGGINGEVVPTREKLGKQTIQGSAISIWKHSEVKTHAYIHMYIAVVLSKCNNHKLDEQGHKAIILIFLIF